MKSVWSAGTHGPILPLASSNLFAQLTLTGECYIDGSQVLATFAIIIWCILVTATHLYSPKSICTSLRGTGITQAWMMSW